MQELTDIVLAFGIGMLVGVGELVGRYRDEPARALRARPAYLYLAINGAASAAALALAWTFDWTFGMPDGAAETRLTQILVAGFGAMGLFRSSLFIYRHQGEDIGIGPVAFLQVMLDATDRAVDRRRAKARDQAMTRIMGDLAFADVVVALPTLALNVMQNFSVEDQMRLGTQVKSLRDQSDLEDRMKVIALGLIVMNIVGEDVLGALVETIRTERDNVERPTPDVGGLAGLISSIASRTRRSGGSTPEKTGEPSDAAAGKPSGPQTETPTPTPNEDGAPDGQQKDAAPTPDPG